MGDHLAATFDQLNEAAHSDDGLRAPSLPYLWIGITRPSYWVESSRAGLNQTHIAFSAVSKAAVHEFCRAGLSAGGRDNGKSGPREGAGDYYGAFVLDPDGNNIEACVRGDAAR